MKLKAESIIVTILLSIAASLASGADKNPSPNTDVPSHFQAFYFDAVNNWMNTVSAYCSEKTADEITCNLIFVEFFPPSKATEFGLEAAVKNDPEVAAELKRNPTQVKEQITREMERGRKEMCADKKYVAYIKDKMRDPQAGPKRRQHFQQILAACSAKDPKVLFDSLSSLEKRTCEIGVHSFSLDFKRIGKGQWFSDRGGPQGVCKVVRTYVLKHDDEKEKDKFDLFWSLSETTLAGDTKSPLCSLFPPVSENELNKPIVWNRDNYEEYELTSCDFIKATGVFPDFPRVP